MAQSMGATGEWESSQKKAEESDKARLDEKGSRRMDSRAKRAWSDEFVTRGDAPEINEVSKEVQPYREGVTCSESLSIKPPLR